MATAKAKLVEGNVYNVKGINAKYTGSKSGWANFVDADGNTIKARAKDAKPAAKGPKAAKGERRFVVLDPETGEPARVATFKLDHYVKHKDESTEGGHRPLDINDDVAGLLRGLSVEDMFAKAASEVRKYRDEKWPGTKAEIEAEFVARYGKLNNGQIRMNLGNVIRGCIKRVEREKALDEAVAADEAA